MTPRQTTAARALPVLLTAGMLAPLAAPAHGLLIRDDVPLSAHTDLAAESPFSATGGFEINGVFESSGVLVAPNLVLGAAHPGAAITAENSPSSVTFVIDGVSYDIASVDRLDPSSAGANDAADGRDVALYTLTLPVADITPATVYSGTPESVVGLEAVYTGAGLQGTGLTGPNTTNGVVLAGTNIIDNAGLTVSDGQGGTTTFADTILFADFDDPNGLGGASATALETQATVGDSGGGLFVFNDDTNQYELAALHSFILTDGSDDFGFGSFTASTTFLPEDLATIQTAISQAVIPEPATAALLGLALPLIAGRRRRA